MSIIKLDAIDSTNAYLKKISAREDIANGTVVVAKEQTSGRGQMGTHWLSEAGKNLTFSVYYRPLRLDKEQQFYMSMAISLALIEALRYFKIPYLKIKWPNDILSANSKICGVLIENILKQNSLYASIIGIGLNVNQTDFSNLPKASSMKQIKGVYFDLDEVLDQIMGCFIAYEKLLYNHEYKRISELYATKLFRKDKPSTFKKNNEEIFMGFIKGVSQTGKLQVLLENNILKEYNMKEIELMY